MEHSLGLESNLAKRECGIFSHIFGRGMQFHVNPTDAALDEQLFASATVYPSVCSCVAASSAAERPAIKAHGFRGSRSFRERNSICIVAVGVEVKIWFRVSDYCGNQALEL